MTSARPVTPDIDYSALDTRPTRKELRRYKKWARTSEFRFPNATVPRIAAVFSLLLVLLLGFIVFALAAAMVLFGLFIEGTTSFAVRIGLGALGIAIAAIGFYFLFRNVGTTVAKLRNPWVRRWKLSVFASQNGFIFMPISGTPPVGGSIIVAHPSSRSWDRLIARTGRAIEVGNYSRLVGNFVDGQIFAWGYLALELDRNLPHIVLRSTVLGGRRGGIGIPGSFRSDQRLTLEGDFNKYFQLFAPRGYETDALYIFTPDLMALMMDNVAAMDVEIVDNRVLFYSPRPFDLTSRRTMRRLMRIVRIVGAKTIKQTTLYRDDRVGDFAVDRVAPPGQRLRQGIAVSSIIATVAWVVFQVLRVYVWTH